MTTNYYESRKISIWFDKMVFDKLSWNRCILVFELGLGCIGQAANKISVRKFCYAHWKNKSVMRKTHSI